MICLYPYADLPTNGRSTAPLAEFVTAAPVRHVRPLPGGGPLAAVLVLRDRTLWTIEFPDPTGSATSDDGTRAVQLVEDLGGDARHVVCTRRAIVVVIAGHGSYSTLLEIDRRTGGIARRASIPLANVVTVRPLDPRRSDLMVVVDARHGAFVVGFAPDRDGSEVQVTPFDPEARITAVTALDERWLVAARKGGELVKIPRSTATGGRVDPATEVCREVHSVPRRRGAGGVIDDEPCERKQSARLGWSVATLDRVGHHLVAVAARGDRMAVLDLNLTVVFERHLGRHRYRLATGSPSTDRMLALQVGTARLEAWSLDEYCTGIHAVEAQPTIPRRSHPITSETVTYHGRRSEPAAPNPHLRVAVFTVTEPGQSFGDPDQARMQALLAPNVYAVVQDYYLENSFDTLEPEFDVFGVHLGGTRRPLVLPNPIASYFYDVFTPGGVETVMPAVWTGPLTLDGTESMTLRTDPAVGVGKDYPVPFAALWTSRTHSSYPVSVTFTGTETLQVDVTDHAGATHALSLSFGALALSHAQGDDEEVFLAAVGQHVTTAVRAAEVAAGLPPQLQDVVFRRIRGSDDDSVFGRLQGELSVTPAAGGAPQKGRVSIVPPAVLSAPLTVLGLVGAGGQDGVLASLTETTDYLRECLHAARFDAGEGIGLNDPQLAADVVAEEDTTAHTARVQIQLTRDKGGAGARITVLKSAGLVASGWSGATPVPGSQSTSNNQNTMRFHRKLADDVFTAAMDHLRATGPWDAETVRAQFATFDAMMIGFVGACPATVPVANRWNAVDAVDFGRLRMFVRHHQATDLHNPDPSQPPVTMGTDLLIGQRFNQFDPGVMSHEIGHGLGLPDLYFATGFRDDVVYVDRWCQMAGGNSRFNHFCAWSKWSVGWIAQSDDDALNRVIDVDMPSPSGVSVTEAWLVPVEYWDAAMRADVVAAVGSGVAVGQVMLVHLGSDGGVVDLIEFRAPGRSYSQQLPPTPAVIVTNVLQPGTDQRWAVNGLYRREVHLLNDGTELIAVGDTWDFATGHEFPLKGCQVEIVDLRTIRGGSIPICRVRVERQPAEFIDLYFQDNVPSWRSPDIWVDWPGDNPDPSVPRVYPEGTPTDQGETVRFPGSGVEPHFMVVRPHNAGNIRAEDVKVRWFICDPPGAGDRNRWVERDTQTLPELSGNTWAVVPFTWAVNPATNAHQCIRAEIIDWTIPAGVDPATGDTVALSSDDVRLQNNNAQKNVTDFEATT